MSSSDWRVPLTANDVKPNLKGVSTSLSSVDVPKRGTQAVSKLVSRPLLLQVCKVYLGSFNDKPIRSDLNPAGVELFEREQEKLLQDLFEIPQRSCDRKVWPFTTELHLIWPSHCAADLWTPAVLQLLHDLC